MASHDKCMTSHILSCTVMECHDLNNKIMTLSWQDHDSVMTSHDIDVMNHDLL